MTPLPTCRANTIITHIPELFGLGIMISRSNVDGEVGYKRVAGRVKSWQATSWLTTTFQIWRSGLQPKEVWSVRAVLFETDARVVRTPTVGWLDGLLRSDIEAEVERSCPEVALRQHTHAGTHLIVVIAERRGNLHWPSSLKYIPHRAREQEGI